jgi:hypothetical protein
MLFELLIFVIGIGFGFFHRGKEDYTGIIKNGAVTGSIVGIIFVLVSLYLVPGYTSINLNVLGVFGIIIEVILFVIIFILGAFVGDKIETLLRK